MATKPAKPLTTAEKIQRWEATKEAGQQLYQQADDLQDQIEKELKLNAPHNLGDGREAVLIDPWEEAKAKNKNKIWRHVGVRRFEIEIRSQAAHALTKLKR